MVSYFDNTGYPDIFPPFPHVGIGGKVRKSAEKCGNLRKSAEICGKVQKLENLLLKYVIFTFSRIVMDTDDAFGFMLL